MLLDKCQIVTEDFHFCIAVLGTVLSFLLLGFANSLWMIFLLHAFEMSLEGNAAFALAYIAEITEPKYITKRLGRNCVAFGMGFIIRPFIGAVLSLVGLNLSAFVAATIAILNSITVLILMPESLPTSEHQQMRYNPNAPFNIHNLIDELWYLNVGPY